MPLIPVGRLTVATPETMAASVYNPTVARDAVDARITEILSSDPGVAAAAAAAVAAALASMDVMPKKCLRIESGQWVWDISSAATHYLIPDDTGALIARPTVWPVPASTPQLNW